MKPCVIRSVFGLSLALVSGVLADDPGERVTDPFPLRQGPEYETFPDPAGRLAAMKEPSVMAPLKKGVDRVFRMMVMPAFDEQVVVRVVQRGDRVEVSTVGLTLDTDYNPREVLHRKSWILEGAEKKAVLSLLEKKEAWQQMNAQEKMLMQIIICLDGTEFLYEIHDRDGYRLIELTNPDLLAGFSKDRIREVGLNPEKIRDFSVQIQAIRTLIEMVEAKLKNQ
jgi:hypothetical protein